MRYRGSAWQSAGMTTELLFCKFVFMFASAAMEIIEHRPINVDSQPGIESETLRFQDNHEANYATEATTEAWRNIQVL